MRAPWSRGSASTAVPSSAMAGTGLVRGSRAARRVAASSRVPRPRRRMPPAPSGVRVRSRPRWAARSSRARSASALRSSWSGSTWARTRAPAWVSWVASRRLASSIRRVSARSRRFGLVGSLSRASQITPACTPEIRPSVSASRVASRSLVRSWAWRMARCPARRVSPARWAYQSPAEAQASLRRGRSRPPISPRSCARSAARWASCSSNATTASSSSPSPAPAHSRSVSGAICASARPITSAGMVLEGASIVGALR